MLRTLERAELDEATDLLSRACPFDAAARVAGELLFGPAPGCVARPMAAVRAGRLAGVAVVSGAWLRVLAVDPACRGAGVGSALLAWAEAELGRAGVRRARVLDQPGNYLAPGVDVRNGELISWLERRGYQVSGENVNLLVDVRHNPRVSAARADELAARAHGHVIRRATLADQPALERLIQAEFSAAWAFEVTRALAHEPPGVHLAWQGSELAAFAAHDGNNQGLGWFGPAGTLPAHRGRGLGEALLCACLVDVAAAGHDVCEVAWIGPRGFYERAVGVAGERRFAVLKKDLP